MRKSLGYWATGAHVKICFLKDLKWVAGRVEHYVTAEDRIQEEESALARAGVMEAIPDVPRHKRGKYLVSWNCVDNPTFRDKDYFLDGDATLKLASDKYGDGRTV